jgi:predicted O-methyltransferase YrrM
MSSSSRPASRRFHSWIRRTLFPETADPGTIQRVGSFAVRYGTAAALSAFLFAGGLSRKRHRVLLDDILSHFGIEPERPRPDIPSLALREILSDRVPVVIQEPVGRDGNVSLLELLVIAHLVAARQPETVFEIGTFDGRTTLNLAANTSGNVFTLDLPASGRSTAAFPLDPGDGRYISKPGSGARFAGTQEARRITELYGDSATFDFSPWEGRMDMVFVDGAHSLEYVLNDTDRALRLLRPEGGVILWHDYDACFNGVTEALNEVARSGLDVRRIEATSLAILILDDSERAG